MKKYVFLSIAINIILLGCQSNTVIKFKDYAQDPVVLTMGDEGEWDAGAMGSMTIVEVQGIYHMYYEAWGDLSETGTAEEYHTIRIGHATSKDGINWEKDPANPVIPAGVEGEWDGLGTWDPFLIYEDGIFKMWYGGNDETYCNLGFATSTDGSNFKKKGRFTHALQCEDIHMVHNPGDDKYYLFYWDRDQAPWKEVMDSLPPLPSGLFLAISDDETNFDFENARRLKVEGQNWPVKYSHVIREGDEWVMFFGEAVTRGNPSSTGIATSTDLINWEKRVFPVVKGHDAEVFKMGEDDWFLYYAPDAYFDWPDCDIRLATYKGELSDLYE